MTELSSSALLVFSKNPTKYHRGMIARHWRGWTKTQHADAYEDLLRKTVLPGLSHIDGYRGGYVLRNDGPEESEFIVINFFASLDAVRRFAGEDYATPVFEPQAKKLLSRFEPIAMHYAVKASTMAENFGPD